MSEKLPEYGLWWLVAINSLIFVAFAFSFTRPKAAQDWRSFGALSAFFVALFTEMYGFPLTIYLFYGWLSSRFPQIDWRSHDSGHLLEMMFGWGGNPHVGPFHLLSSVFILSGFIVVILAWRILYRAQREHTLATTGPYALVRHPQYVGFVSIMFGFLLQWPTLPTVLMFPILVYMYLRLARHEEREAAADFGVAYQSYRERTPAFVPRFGDVLTFAAIAFVIFGVPVVIANLAAPEARVATSVAMSEDMQRQRVQVDALSKQMQTLDNTLDPALRRDLVRSHLEALRGLGSSLHAMNLKMIDDVDNGRIVSDAGLKQRLQLNADFMYMQLQMLEAAMKTGGMRIADAVTNGKDVRQ